MNQEIIEERPVPMDELKRHYYRLKNKLIKEGEIEEISGNILPILMRAIREKLIKGEQLKIVVCGQTTTGKSTVAAYLKLKIHQIIMDIPKIQQQSTYKGEQQEYELIASNQIEFMRIARRNDLKHVCCQIDEFSDLAGGGRNATTEADLMEFYDKVCAQNYLHVIFCTPKDTYNKYGVIILEVIDSDKEEQFTKVKIYYNNPTDPQPLLIGRADINISEILNKQFYKLYLQRKHFAISLPLQHGIRDVRELEIALVSLITYQKCQDLARIGKKEREVISLDANTASREIKAVYSMVTEAEIISRASALLTLQVLKRNTLKNITNPKIKEEDKNDLRKEYNIYNKKLEELLKTQTDLIQLYLQYMGIGNPTAQNELKNTCKKYNIKIEEETKNG